MHEDIGDFVLRVGLGPSRRREFRGIPDRRRGRVIPCQTREIGCDTDTHRRRGACLVHKVAEVNQFMKFNEVPARSRPLCPDVDGLRDNPRCRQWEEQQDQAA